MCISNFKRSIVKYFFQIFPKNIQKSIHFLKKITQPNIIVSLEINEAIDPLQVSPKATEKSQKKAKVHDKNEEKNTLIPKLVKRKCEYCQGFPENYENHVKICKLCDRFVTKNDEKKSFKCQICSFSVSNMENGRNLIHKHIMDIHKER